jgi:hypothetical protein
MRMTTYSSMSQVIQWRITSSRTPEAALLEALALLV